MYEGSREEGARAFSTMNNGESAGVAFHLTKSSGCLAFLNPDGHRSDLISEILGDSALCLEPSASSSFLLSFLRRLATSPVLRPQSRCSRLREYGASFSKYRKTPSEFRRRVIGTPLWTSPLPSRLGFRFHLSRVTFPPTPPSPRFSCSTSSCRIRDTYPCLAADLFCRTLSAYCASSPFLLIARENLCVGKNISKRFEVNREIRNVWEFGIREFYFRAEIEEI